MKTVKLVSLVAVLVTIATFGVQAGSQQECITSSVAVSPSPVAVGSSVTVTQTVTESCTGGNHRAEVVTTVSSTCAGTVEIAHYFVKFNGGPDSIDILSQYSPPCADTYTVTSTVVRGGNKSTSVTATFVAQ